MLLLNDNRQDGEILFEVKFIREVIRLSAFLIRLISGDILVLAGSVAPELYRNRAAQKMINTQRWVTYSYNILKSM